MSVYTPVSPAELTTFLQSYPAGELLDYSGITAGIENTNYFVTTTGGDFVLTLFEHHTPQELPYFLDLMAHWAQAGIPSAAPLATHQGELLSTLNGKPAALVQRLAGSHANAPTMTQCAEVGATLAQMHNSSDAFPHYRASDRGHDWRMQTAQHVLPHLSPDDAALLQAECAYQQTIPFAQLPSGTIHADLFRDNALFADGKLSGVLDVYFACTDTLLYDLAVVVNDWCCHADGSLDDARYQACVQAYQQTRPWNALEQTHWLAMLRAAALRFWLSRWVAKLNPRDGALTQQKDPSEFRDKLRQRVALATTPQSVTVDARRLLCPMPVIRVQQAVAKLPAGTHVTAICTDPGALHDIPAWARIHGHSVVATHSEGREHTITICTGQRA